MAYLWINAKYTTMKKIVTLFLVIFSAPIFSQNKPAIITINSNGILANTNSIGAIFCPTEKSNSSGFAVSENKLTDYISTIYRSGINIAGFTDGQLGVMSTSIRSDDFFLAGGFPGPFSDQGSINYKYNKVWSVKKWEIQSTINDYEDNQQIDNIPSLNILTWPGNKNPLSLELDGLDWNENNYAPFYDRNNDGIYNPFEGDYPVLEMNCKEKIPDEMLWSVYFSDYGSPEGLEVQKLIYAFQSDSIEQINNTLFVRLTINSYLDTLKQARMSLYNDFDLGCPLDDMVGTSESTNSIYAYNLTSEDLKSCYPNKSFKKATPNQSITILNKKMLGSMMSNPYGLSLSDTLTNLKLYDLMNNKWPDGTPLTYGGNGYNPNSTEFINYLYSESPTKSNGWSMAELAEVGLDIRLYVNLDLGDIYKDSPAIVDLAYTHHPADTSIAHYSNVDSMLEHIPMVQSFYERCFNSDELHQPCESDCVWPGDADRNGIVNNLDALHIGISKDTAGIRRLNTTKSWAPFTAEEWNNISAENINYKHFDCNGDGIIDAIDYQINVDNFYLKNKEFTEWGGYNDPGNELSFVSKKDIFGPSEIIELNIVLGQTDSISLAGLAFTVEYDETKLTLMTFNPLYVSIGSPDNSFELIQMEDGKVHIALVKTNNQEAKFKNANIGKMRFLTKNGVNEDFISIFKFSNYEQISSEGKISPLTASPKTISITKTISTKENLITRLHTFPNPTSNSFTIESNRDFNEIKLIDNYGNCYIMKLNNDQYSTENIPSGFYIIHAKDESGRIFVGKLIIIK